MNKKQLMNLNLPADCVRTCINLIRDGRASKKFKKSQIKSIVTDVLSNPLDYIEDEHWGQLANEIIKHRELVEEDANREPISFNEWGSEGIDDATRKQMSEACKLPMAVGGALCADAHVGYGLPIGGVLATEGFVIPYAVGFDIACRMRMTIIDENPETLDSHFEKYRMALEKGTLFGIGTKWQNNKHHEVLDKNWNITPITSKIKDKASEQLGSSGSGNHFCEFGVLEVTDEDKAKELNIAPRKYVALLSHSGSRGAGGDVCKHYSQVAQQSLPERYECFKFLAWLSLESEAGQEYWLAMNLMGEYAAANHEIIHRDVVRLIGGQPIAVVENHHNFAWKEQWNGREVIVHRKGATPASEGTLGVIPGSMGDSCFVVRGKGSQSSINSASHGAGRAMSRRQAKEQMNWAYWGEELKRRGVTLLSGGIDEVPGAYKPIAEVMNAQSDLVDTIAKFDPKIVKMSP
jgi:tRNA-splicing ligase RtcB